MKSNEFKYFSEQVSHHPPISAAYASSNCGTYELWMNTKMKSVFWGASLDVEPLGLIHVKLGNFPNELYSIQRPKTAVKNMIVGSMYIEHYGPMTIKRTDLEGQVNPDDSYDFENVQEMVLDFKAGGWYKNKRNVVEGQVPVKAGSDKFWKITGKWTEDIVAFNEETEESVTLFKAKPFPPQHDWQYLFTKFAINLNNLPDELVPFLPPTDSRLRPDQRAHENGDFT